MQGALRLLRCCGRRAWASEPEPAQGPSAPSSGLTIITPPLTYPQPFASPHPHVQPLSHTSAHAGPRSITRTAQAVDAVLSVARDSLRALQAGGSPDPPPAVLRTLFERLGSTYIKLGQFIASSPTLFPEEYVLEFQKCLDQTTPVPFEVVRCVDGMGFAGFLGKSPAAMASEACGPWFGRGGARKLLCRDCAVI